MLDQQRDSSGPITRAAAYARSATANPAAIEEQEAACRDAIAAQGWSLHAVYRDDGVSGLRLDGRPGLDTLLAAVDAGEFDVLVVTGPDRLARDATALSKLASRLAGVRLHWPGGPVSHLDAVMIQAIGDAAQVWDAWGRATAS